MVYERCKSAGALLFRIYNMTQPPAHGKLYFSVSLITYWPQEPQFLYYFLTTNFHNFLHWYWTFIIFLDGKKGFFKIYDNIGFSDFYFESLHYRLKRKRNVDTLSDVSGWSLKIYCICTCFIQQHQKTKNKTTQKIKQTEC